MSSGQYVLGVVLLGVIVGSLGVSASLFRRMLLPTWSQAPARLAEAVIGLATLVILGEVLGTVGELKRWPLVLSTVAMTLPTFLLFRRRVGAPAGVRVVVVGGELVAPHPGIAPTAAAILTVTLAVSRSMQNTLNTFHAGMGSFDTLWYHMPFAAEFVQDASVTRLHYVGNAPTSFYPANSELIHAIGILLFQRDVLSPVLNFGWLGLALLAAWCIGRPAGVGPGTMAATALVVSLPVMGSAEAGTALNDVVALALLLAAVALLVSAPSSRAALVLAALAAGLAAGTRLNLWASVLALGVVVVVSTGDGRRFGAGVRWVLGIVGGSGFWYVRNLVEVGNPLPWFGVKIAGVLTLPATMPPVDCGRTPVAHYLTDASFAKTYLLPQLPSALGARWWVVVSLATAGVGAGLLSRHTLMGRGIAAVALMSGVAYVLTPATAGGEEARCFAFNTRFAIPALALGLIVLPLVLSRRGVDPLVAILAVALALGVTVHGPFEPQALLATIILMAGVTAVVFETWRRLPRPAFAAALVVLGVALGAAGWREQHVYLRDRYEQPQLAEPVEGIYGVLRHVSHARVAVTGFAEHYPFYGLDLSNRVEYPAARVAARFAPYSTCRSWLLALRRGQYDYVVTARQSERASPAAAWTRRYPGARQVLASAPGTQRNGKPWQWQLFRLGPARRVDTEAACAEPAPSSTVPLALQTSDRFAP